MLDIRSLEKCLLEVHGGLEMLKSSLVQTTEARLWTRIIEVSDRGGEVRLALGSRHESQSSALVSIRNV